MTMDRIEKLQYKNLRKCFYENLVDPILGEDYYNMAMDIYECDRQTTLDIKRRYDSLKKDNDWYKLIITVLIISNIIALAF